MIDIQSALKKVADRLQQTSSSPRLDAEVLLAHVLDKSRTYLYSYSEKILNEEEYQRYQALINQRAQGMPIAYLTGHREFWSMDLKVNAHTLIPRPATEKLVEVCLALLDKQKNAKILDLGTGSGAVALALARERPDWQISASDIHPDALKIARENAQGLGLGNIKFYLSDWFSELPSERYHAIVSNPPYIAENDPHLQQGDLRFEPINALVSQEDGLLDLKTIIINSYEHLLEEGYLLLEHGHRQKALVESILYQSGFTAIQCWKDCEGNERISGGKR